MTESQDRASTLEAIARLEVQLETVLQRLSEVSSNMVSKDLFVASQQNFEFRFRTIEEAVAKWRGESIGEHVKLDADSKARYESAQTDSRKRHEDTKADIRDLRLRLDNAEEENKKNKNARIQLFIGSGLALATSLIRAVFNYGLR